MRFSYPNYPGPVLVYFRDGTACLLTHLQYKHPHQHPGTGQLALHSLLSDESYATIIHHYTR